MKKLRIPVTEQHIKKCEVVRNQIGVNSGCPVRLAIREVRKEHITVQRMKIVLRSAESTITLHNSNALMLWIVANDRGMKTDPFVLELDLTSKTADLILEDNQK